MLKSNAKILEGAPHLDQEGFAAAIVYTGQVTGFRADLIEKDYFCSIVLAFLFSEETALVFKGGTCLNKVHAGFYRLSEDLDFSIAVEDDVTRGDRRRVMQPVKLHFSRIQKAVPSLKIISDLMGHNEGRQYTATLGYQSAIAPMPGTIKFEVGLREPMLEKVTYGKAGSLAIDPFRKTRLLAPVDVACLSAREAFAEKIRAALTRKDPAIRDLFDLDYAIRYGKASLEDRTLIQLAKSKIQTPGMDAIDVSASKLKTLREQLATELRPVLRPDDYASFDFDRAVSRLAELAKLLE